MTNRQTESAKKRVFKSGELCYSIGEAHNTSCRRRSREAPIWADGRKVPRDESFKNGWRYISSKELSANVYSSGEIDLVVEFSAGLTNGYVRSDQFAEVVHDEPGKDFLPNVLHFFSVKTKKPQSVFEFTKRGFNSPTHSVKLFQLINRETVRIEICNDRLEVIIRQTKAHNAKVQGKESVIVNRQSSVVQMLGRDILEMGFILK